MWINGHEYKVIRDKGLENNHGVLGSCSLRTDKIFLDGDMSISHQEDVLFHEILEAINHFNELKLNHEYITCIAQNFYSILKTNKLIVKDILKKV